MAGSPNVRVEGGVFSDLRYSALGDLMGTSRYDAIGRMTVLWHHCTVHHAHVLSEQLVATVVNPNALIQSLLGERVDGGIRIRGTSGRIEWYRDLQESGKKSAAKRWKKRPRVTHNQPNGSPMGGPKEKEIDKETSLVLSSPKGKEGRGEKGGAVEHELPDGWTPTAEHVALAAELKLDLSREVAKFRAHAEANGRKQKRWNASFTGWLHNAPAFAGRGGGGAARPDQAADLWAEAQRLKELGR